MYDILPSTAPDGRKRMTAQFYKSVRDLFRAGPEAFDKLVYTTLDRRLDADGGIGPYKHYEVRKDGVVAPHLLVAEEE